MKVEYPKWIYHPTEQAHIILEGPIPEGWFESPADCIVTGIEYVKEVKEPVAKPRKKRTPKAK